MLMITELFSMLSNLDVTKGKGGKLNISANLKRNRIRSISAYSSNSIFYFQTITSDQATPEEMGMVSRVLEKSYASFVVACISLMPFHRIKADDQASIEEYLSQFHQNMGIAHGADETMGRMLGLVSTLGETATAKKKDDDDEDKDHHEPTDEELKETQAFLEECWRKSYGSCTRFIKIISETVSLNDMYSIDPIDPLTRTIQERYEAVLDELNTWGFVGDATADMLDGPDDAALEYMSDEEILAGADMDDGDDFDEDMYPELDSYLTEGQRGLDPDELEKARKELRENWEREHPGVPMPKGRNRAHDETLTEGNVKAAVNSIMFSLESVSENKIKSCSNLTKLNSLEAKLNKLKNKYAKYLTRYKKKYKENQKKGSNSKLSIRFNGETITNPKAFMQQYGAYIKIINKRLKLVEKRRAELRSRKGIPDTGKKLEESAINTLTDLDLESVDYCISVVESCINAPDEEVFGEVITEASKRQLYDQIDQLQQELDDLRADYAADMTDMDQRNKTLGNAVNQKQAALQQEMRVAKHSQEEARKQKLRNTQMTRDLHKANMSERELQAKLKELQKEKNQLEKQVASAKNSAPQGYTPPQRDVPEPDYDSDDLSLTLTYDKSRPRSGLNVARAAANGQTKFTTFDKEVFTNMDMKKSNEAIPTFTRASIGFIVDETEQVVTRDVLIGIKVYIHKAAAMDLINDIYNCLINKRKFLKFVKWISGEEKSLADLLFGFKELKTDALNSRGKTQWASAFRRRKRWAKMSVPYLMKEYTPNGSLVLTMNEVQFIRDEYGIDIMNPDHVNMIMDASFLLGFVILDQANEMCYITYDGHGGNFQQYTYAMLEREQQTSDRMLRELYRSISR